MQNINFYNLHLPDKVRLIQIPPECIRLWNKHVLVYDLRVYNLIIRHFSFYDRWYVISYFLNEKGEIESLPGDIPIGFICDISSPQFSFGTNIYNTDLAYDILVSPDGSDFKLINTKDYKEFESKEFMSPYEATRAQETVNALTETLRTTNINDLLEEVFPGHQKNLNFKIPSLGSKNQYLSEVPQLAKLVRDREFGKKIP